MSERVREWESEREREWESESVRAWESEGETGSLAKTPWQGILDRDNGHYEVGQSVGWSDDLDLSVTKSVFSAPAHPPVTKVAVCLALFWHCSYNLNQRRTGEQLTRLAHARELEREMLLQIAITN